MRVTRRQLVRIVKERGIMPKEHVKMVVGVVFDAVEAGLEKSDKVSLTSSDGSIILIAEKCNRRFGAKPRGSFIS